jgi:endonuclease YncB( thermonuclease family)
MPISGDPLKGSAALLMFVGLMVGLQPPAAAQLQQRRLDRPLASGHAWLISVGDGDTIRVATASGEKVTIRLACIDAPEAAQGESGAQATAALRQLLAGSALEIRPQTVDRYGRTVAEVYASGRNVNLELVKSGAAYVYRQYLAGCDQRAYLSAEREAEIWRRGVWRSGGNEQRPWDFRKSR